MIYSMTGFARSQAQGTWGSMVCEMRSVNHRFLELALRLPEAFHAIEGPMRDRIREQIKRGKVECFLRFQPKDEHDDTITINEKLVSKIASAGESISKILKNRAPINPLEILRWPGVLTMDDIDFTQLEAVVMQILDQALHQLLVMRAREGDTLSELFFQRLNLMTVELNNVRKRMPTLLMMQKERLKTRFTDANLIMDQTRLEQELVIFCQKIDVSEEIDRLQTHINEVSHIIKHGGLIGRRLDFLMQELNREANTLGAKSVDAETSHAAVELKVLIEQLREQVQNIE